VVAHEGLSKTIKMCVVIELQQHILLQLFYIFSNYGKTVRVYIN